MKPGKDLDDHSLSKSAQVNENKEALFAGYVKECGRVGRERS